ncbi:MAG: hypothetical protein HY226_05225 [Candidatus Vogelbacteria bacterium]|nr:hypothetical protein [Candidatus Vogelbacteria bacterium]
MGNFNKDRGDRDNRGGNGGFGGGQRRPQVMHQATCNECNKSCEVPFRPSGDKPVYCKDCFAQKGGGQNRHQDERFPRKDFGDRGPRPSFNNNRRPDQQRPAGGGDDVKRLIESLGTKIDRLINSVENLAHMKFNPVSATSSVATAKVVETPVKSSVVEKPAKKTKEVKKTVTKKGKK